MTRIGRASARAALAALVVTATAIQPVQAQDAAAGYPNKPIRMIVGFAAGGGNDLFARLIGQKLTPRTSARTSSSRTSPAPAGGSRSTSSRTSRRTATH
jgi:tripartite-type tricarboxylate transporter receptor subunit TctC